MNLEITVLNVRLLFSLMLLMVNAIPAHKGISTTQPQTDVSVEFHVILQEVSTKPQEDVCVQLIKKGQYKFMMYPVMHAFVH